MGASQFVKKLNQIQVKPYLNDNDAGKMSGNRNQMLDDQKNNNPTTIRVGWSFFKTVFFPQNIKTVHFLKKF